MQELNIEEMLKGVMGEMSGVKDAITIPVDRNISNTLLFETAKRHIQGLLEQPTLTAGQVALLGPLVNLVAMYNEW